MATASGGDLIAANRRRVFKLTSDGRLDRSFGGDGNVRIGTQPSVKFLLAAVAVDSRDRVLLAGTTQPRNPSNPGSATLSGPPPAWATIYRYLPDGHLDHSFGNGGVVATAFDQPRPTGPSPWSGLGPEPYQSASVRVSEMTVDAEDRPIVTGLSINRAFQCPYPYSVVYTSRSYIARLTTDGNSDPSFGTGGVVTDGYVERPVGLAIGPTGKIAFTTPTHYPCQRVPADSFTPMVGLLRDDGAPGRRFVAGEPINTGQTVHVRAVEFDRRGRIVLLLERVFWESGELAAMTVRRLFPDGSPDMGFGRGGSISPKLPRRARLVDLTIDRRGRVLLAGSAPRKGGGGRSFLLGRLSSAGKIEPRFGHGGWTKTSFLPWEDAQASQISIDDRGRIVVGGTLTTPLLEPSIRLGIARYFAGQR